MNTCNDGGAHHYELSPADGSERIQGKCKKCGHERDWPASVEEAAIVWSANSLQLMYKGDRKNTRIL